MTDDLQRYIHDKLAERSSFQDKKEELFWRRVENHRTLSSLYENYQKLNQQKDRQDWLEDFLKEAVILLAEENRDLKKLLGSPQY